MFKFPGVYLITCKVNNKKYVGCSNNIDRRWAWHRSNLRNGTHHNQHLQRAWNKYGSEAFVFTLLEETDVDSRFDRETEYINKLRPEYNMKKNDYTSPDRWKYTVEIAEEELEIVIDPQWLFGSARLNLNEDQMISMIDRQKADREIDWAKAETPETEALSQVARLVAWGEISEKKLKRLLKSVGWTYKDYCDKLSILEQSKLIPLTPRQVKMDEYGECIDTFLKSLTKRDRYIWNSDHFYWLSGSSRDENRLNLARELNVSEEHLIKLLLVIKGEMCAYLVNIELKQ